MLVLIDHEGLSPFVTASIKDTATRLLKLYNKSVIDFELKFNYSSQTQRKTKKKIHENIKCDDEYVSLNYVIRLLILL